MRRLRRILLNAMTALSAMLCLVSAIAWARSYAVTDRLIFQAWAQDGDRWYWTQDVFLCGRGGVGMNRIVQSFDAPTAATLKARYGSIAPHSTAPAEYPNFHVGVGDSPVWGGFKRGGFSHGDTTGSARPRAYGWQYVVPLWAVAPPLAVLPAVYGWLLLRRRRRVGVGCCVACGYDLRATPDRCPECGTEPEPKRSL